MDGITLTRIVDKLMEERQISRPELCNAIGITSAAYTNWKNGGQPRKDKIEAIEKFFGINLDDYTNPFSIDDDAADVLNMMKDDFAYKALFRSAKGLTPAEAYIAASFITKLKAGEIKSDIFTS